MQTLCNRPAVAGQEAVCASDSARLCVRKPLALQAHLACFEQSVRAIQDRFGVSADLAAVVAQLAGLGPREVRND